MATYSYFPLSFASNQIRLLSLEPAKERSAPLVCSLSKISLNSPPPFEALLYTWGAFGDDAVILHSIPFKVTANLDSALRDIRHEISDRTLWIDAVCINQDDVLERNHQVTKMRQVYQAASKVVVWLGPETEDSAEVRGRVWVQT